MRSMHDQVLGEQEQPSRRPRLPRTRSNGEHFLSRQTAATCFHAAAFCLGGSQTLSLCSVLQEWGAQELCAFQRRSLQHHRVSGENEGARCPFRTCERAPVVAAPGRPLTSVCDDCITCCEIRGQQHNVRVSFNSKRGSVERKLVMTRLYFVS
ncbi:hypothetical protein TRVL_08301 [Trypanosoma vivax]|nr:hypothetical protein TRVL_08301 [Trypanosoma vivax]